MSWGLMGSKGRQSILGLTRVAWTRDEGTSALDIYPVGAG